jgi:hypothetical protein
MSQYKFFLIFAKNIGKIRIKKYKNNKSNLLNYTIKKSKILLIKEVLT